MAESVKDVIARFVARGPAEPEKPKPPETAKLLPDRHPTPDFFVADILHWAVKDDRSSMEHPIFALSKTPDRKVRNYEHNGITVTVTPPVIGRANIWDKDVLIYAVSQLVEAANQGRSLSRTVHLKAYDLLVATNRHAGGQNYERLKTSLERLAGTRIKTNIATNGRRIDQGFGLIDNWTIERAPSGTMTAVKITLNEWLFNAVLAREVLTLSRDYFRLDGGLERRLYELARKHCGHQPQMGHQHGTATQKEWFNGPPETLQSSRETHRQRQYPAGLLARIHPDQGPDDVSHQGHHRPIENLSAD